MLTVMQKVEKPNLLTTLVSKLIIVLKWDRSKHMTSKFSSEFFK